MASSASINPANLELCPMRVTFNGVDLGGTKGGVKVSVSYKLTDLEVDQLGKTPVDSRVSGQEYMIKMEFAEIQDKTIWKTAFPHAKLVDNGVQKAMYFDAQIGDSLYARAANLILHPLSHDDSDLSGDYLFWKAAAKSASEIKYGPEEQSVLSVEFRVYPDRSVQPARYFMHGDPSVGLVAASVTQSSFTGTGNGTLTGLGAGPAAVTETITAKLVTVSANGGVFFVSGSVSGAMGLATVGTLFTNSKVHFTINDGSTDFALNDQFVLASVGPNYA